MTRNVVRVAAALRRGAPTTRRVHPPRHRARAGLPARDQRRDDRVLRTLAAAGGRVPGAGDAASGSPPPDAEAALLDHVQVCFDCCHFAVEYEDPRGRARSACAGRHARSAASSSARRSTSRMPAGASAAAVVDRLRPFADTTYLHQVIERRAGRAARTSPTSGERTRRAAPTADRRSGASTSTCRCSPATTTASGPRRPTSRA